MAIFYILRFTFHINCEKSCFTGKPLMDLVDPSQVDHEGGSGAGPEVDHKGDALHCHVQETPGGTSFRIVHLGVWGDTKLFCCLKHLVFKISSPTLARFTLFRSCHNTLVHYRGLMKKNCRLVFSSNMSPIISSELPHMCKKFRNKQI